jgi:hypothetical protein
LTRNGFRHPDGSQQSYRTNYPGFHHIDLRLAVSSGGRRKGSISLRLDPVHSRFKDLSFHTGTAPWNLSDPDRYSWETRLGMGISPIHED